MVKGGAQQSAKLVIGGRYVTPCSDGAEYCEVRMPPSTFLAGAIDISGYLMRVRKSRVKPYNFDPAAVEVHMARSRTVRLTSADGKSSCTALPDAVKAAVSAQYRKTQRTKRK